MIYFDSSMFEFLILIFIIGDLYLLDHYDILLLFLLISTIYSKLCFLVWFLIDLSMILITAAISKIPNATFEIYLLIISNHYLILF